MRGSVTSARTFGLIFAVMIAISSPIGVARADKVGVAAAALAVDPRQFDTNSAETVNFGQATLIGVSGNGQVFCESCDFMKWGAWLTAVNVADHPDAEHEQSNPTDHSTQISAVGWWVSGDNLPTIGQLPTLGTASYDGHAIGQVVYYGDSQLAKGDVHMDWDFQQRAGLLDIKNFAVPGSEVPVLNASGRMDVPGIATNLTNRFSGPLLGNLGSEAPSRLRPLAENRSIRQAASSELGEWAASIPLGA